MKPRRSVTIGSVALLATLLALAQAHFVLGVLGPLWRTAVVSWDNPASQVVDELACESLPHTDPSREAREHAALAPRPCGDVHARSQVAAPGPTLRSRLSRSPPSA
jgi:hypothetical protein